MVMPDTKPVSISTKLYDLISNRIKNPQTGFSTVDEYVEFVLTELLTEDDESETSDEEVEQIREELKKLGYV